MSESVRVVTYQLAYVSGLVALCARHADDRRFGTVGSVSIGEHDGLCHACEDDETQRLAAMVSDADLEAIFMDPSAPLTERLEAHAAQLGSLEDRAAIAARRAGELRS